MAHFTTRVELHGATKADYDNLHTYMAAARFRRSITSDRGVVYQLPTAEYDSHGDLSALDVHRLASAAAAKTGKKYWVLVTEAAARVWTLDANPLAVLSNW
jgi:hypothetical protein